MPVPTKITISLPRALAAQVEALRKAEHRTRSGLLQEALRAYFRTRSGPERPTLASAPVVGSRKGRVRSSRAALDAQRLRERERMAQRLLEQSRLSRSLLELKDALARRPSGRGAS